MKKSRFSFWPLIAAMLLPGLSGCRTKVGPTEIEVVDSVRHYYPMLQGQQLEVAYIVRNKGKNPLVLTDIITSCGCVIGDSKNTVVLPGKDMRLKFVFDSSKNTGFVEHSIWLYGNILPGGVHRVRFDINVVPSSTSSPDYEEYYYENYKTDRMIRGLISGYEQERGYWVGDGTRDEDYSTNYQRYPSILLKSENERK